MSPNELILLLTSASGVALTLGGMLVGRATAGRDTSREHKLEGQVRELQGSLAEAKATLAAARSEQTRLQSERDQDSQQKHAALKDAQENVRRLERELESLRAERPATDAAKAPADQQTDLTKLRNQVAALESERDQLRAKLQDSTNLKMQLAALERERDQARAALTDLQGLRGTSEAKRIQELQKQLADTREQLRKAQQQGASSKQATDQELVRLRAQLQEARNAEAKAKATHDQLESEIQALKCELEDRPRDSLPASKETEMLRDRLAASERIMEGVRARSALLNEQLKAAHAEIERLKKGRA